MLQNAYLLAKIGFDTAENELAKKFQKKVNFANFATVRGGPHGGLRVRDHGREGPPRRPHGPPAAAHARLPRGARRGRAPSRDGGAAEGEDERDEHADRGLAFSQLMTDAILRIGA